MAGAGLAPAEENVLEASEATRVAPEAAVRRVLGVQAGEAEPFRVEIEHPADGSIFASKAPLFVAGRAGAGDLAGLDVVVVLDVSGSTAEAAGADVDGDGEVRGNLGWWLDQYGDTILAAEVASARVLVESIDPTTTRVGLVTFSGAGRLRKFQWEGLGTARPYPEEPATTEVALVHDAALVTRGLKRTLSLGAAGWTHMPAALEHARCELVGCEGARSSPRPARRVIVFVSDGVPTLPYRSVTGNERLVVEAAQRAAQEGVVIHTFGVGSDALRRPRALLEIARITGGSFTPVRDPADLVRDMSNTNLRRIERLELWNRTLGIPATEIVLNADGTWAGSVELAPGRNRIEAVAVTDGGETASLARIVHHAPGEARPFVPPALAHRRNQLRPSGRLELSPAEPGQVEER